MNNTVYIPERFKRIIEHHIIKNLAPQVFNPVSLLLGIHGPSGDGKTYQCEYTLEQMGVKVFFISGGELESPRAGEPAERLRTTYIEASESIRERRCQVAVIVMNDIDASLGNWGLVQYTVNRQQVIGELMHMADYPHVIENKKTNRVPIIVTGNDFTKLYGPLVRAGRMKLFSWIPTQEEKVHITSHIFPELNVQEHALLVQEFSEEPIAFYSTLRSTLIDDKLERYLQQQPARQVIDQLYRGDTLKISLKFTYDMLIQTGRALIESGQLANHLQKKQGQDISEFQEIQNEAMGEERSVSHTNQLQ
jgi:hypothetical protein